MSSCVKLVVMYTHVFIVILTATGCFCFAGYELFQGFNETYVDDTSDDAAGLNLISHVNGETEHILYNSTLGTSNSTTPTYAIPLPIGNTVFNCPEEEKPMNIGPYEVPTRRDLVFFTKDMLLEMYNNYNEKAFYLLKDIKEASHATTTIERKCEGNKPAYRQCVKRVSTKCQQIIKNLVATLENQKQEIASLTDNKICHLEDMKTDPMQILKALAQEIISLEFALPGFLQLLNACSKYCHRSAAIYKNKPQRHMTDQALVIKHLLTHKSYLELIKDSKHKSIANSN